MTVFGRIKDLRVDHQSSDDSVPEVSLSTNFLLNDRFASRVIFTTLLRIFLNLRQSLSKYDRFVCSFTFSNTEYFNEEVIQDGYIVLIFTCSFGMHL